MINNNLLFSHCLMLYLNLMKKNNRIKITPVKICVMFYRCSFFKHSIFKMLYLCSDHSGKFFLWFTLIHSTTVFQGSEMKENKIWNIFLKFWTWLALFWQNLFDVIIHWGYIFTEKFIFLAEMNYKVCNKFLRQYLSEFSSGNP